MGGFLSEISSLSLWDGCCLLKNTVIGTVSVGLFIGAIYFAFYLLRLSKLPKSSRQYRQLSYHMQSQTLLRYSITISCLIILNILIYAFIQTGRKCIHIGIAIWLIYFLFGKVANFIRNQPNKVKIQQHESTSNLF